MTAVWLPTVPAKRRRPCAEVRNMLGVLTDLGLHQTHVGATYCDSVLKGRHLKAWGKVCITNETPGYLPDLFQALKERP